MTDTILRPAPPRFATARTERPTAGGEATLIAVELGTPLMPWQQQILDVALEYEPSKDSPGGRRFVYREVAFGTPRQSGKSVLTLVKALHRSMMCGPAQRSVYSAQSGRDAARKLMDDWLPVIEDSSFRHAMTRVRRASGAQGVWFKNRSSLEIVSNNVEAGHGRTVDEAILDEVFSDSDDRREQAMLPAMLTRANAQLIITSTAGDETSLYWRRKVDFGRELCERGDTADVCYFEWSAPDECDPYDERVWVDTMPALGITQNIAAVRHARKTMREEDFRRTMLNQWTRTDQTIIDWSSWVECRNPFGAIQGDIVIAADVNMDRTAATITAASRGADGLVDVEQIDHHEGLAWFVPRLVELRDKHNPWKVIIEGAGPAAAYIPELERAGVSVSIVAGRDIPAACGAFYDHIIQHRLRVRPNDTLDDAVAGAAKRIRGDSFTWRRSTLTSDISPLYCATLAVWGVAGDPNSGAMWLY